MPSPDATLVQAPNLRATAKCQYCSRTVPEYETTKFGEYIVICGQCDIKRRNDLVDFVLYGRSIPTICVLCRESLVRPPVYYKAIWVDGSHQNCCLPCAKRYEAKRRDLFTREMPDFQWV